MIPSKNHLFILCATVLWIAWSLSPSISDQSTTSRRGIPLVVGWNDEFNTPTNWQPFPAPNRPDVSAPRRGLLRLRLGCHAVSNPTPAFYWASVTRIAEVDAQRYPILAVRAIHLKGPSWWDVEIQGYGTGAGQGLVGSEVKTPSLDQDGILLFDLQAQANMGLERNGHKFRLRLSIAGTRKCGAVDYDWVRFVRREDAGRLRRNPRISDLIVEP